jgi:hypothetical protein
LGKNIVFISHIGEEKDLAKLISDQIKSAFLGMLNTFVSSDGDSIPSGSRWLDEIDAALETAAVMITVCSPQSIRRPWINFEAGAAWIRRIPSIPICHSGLSKNQLPIPLSLLQSADLEDESDLDRIFDTLTKVLGSRKPTVDYKSFIEKCRPLVNGYTYLIDIKEAIQSIVNLRPELKNLFFLGECQTNDFRFKEYEYLQAARALGLLEEKELITYFIGAAMRESNGPFRECEIAITEKYLNDVLPLLKWD